MRLPGENLLQTYGAYAGDLDITSTDEGEEVLLLFENSPAVDTEEPVVHSKPFLFNNPDPFYSMMAIRYELQISARARMIIYRSRGEPIEILVDDFQLAGKQQVYWEGSNAMGDRIPPGVYFCVLQVGNKFFTEKILKL